MEDNMKRFLTLVLSAAMLLNICGSSPVFAEKEEALEVIVTGPSAEVNKSMEGDVSEAAIIVTENDKGSENRAMVEVAGNVEGDLNVTVDENKAKSENVVSVKVDGDVSEAAIKVTENEEGSENSAVVEVEGVVEGDLNVAVDGNQAESENAVSVKVGSDVEGLVNIYDGAQMLGMLDSTEGNGKESTNTVTTDIGGDTGGVKIHAGDNDENAVSTVNVSVGGDVKATDSDNSNGVSIWSNTEKEGEEVEVTVHVAGDVTVTNSKEMAGKRAISDSGSASGANSSVAVTIETGDITIDGSGNNSAYTGVNVDQDLSGEEEEEFDISGISNLLLDLIDSNSTENLRAVLHGVLETVMEIDISTIIGPGGIIETSNPTVLEKIEKWSGLIQDWNNFCKENGKDPIDIFLDSHIAQRLHTIVKSHLDNLDIDLKKMISRIIPEHSDDKASGNITSTHVINVGNVTVNVTGEDGSGSGIIVSPSVLGDNNTYTVSINADSINVNSSGWADGLESTPQIKGNDNTTEFNIHVNGDLIVEAGINATGINARNSDITIDGNVRTEADGTAKAINVRNNTKVTVGGGVESTGDGIIIKGNGNTVVIGEGEEAMTGHDLSVKGSAVTVEVSTGENEEKNTVVVEGTVSAEDKLLVLNVGDAADSDAVLANLPDIIVQSIDPDADIVVSANSSDFDQDAVIGEMFAKISYIVTALGADEAKVAIVGTETKTVGETTYMVAHENNTILVKNLGDGKIVGVSTGGDHPIADVTDNGDGSYSITVKRGGNLAISVEYDGTITDHTTPVNTTPVNNAEPVVVTMSHNTETAGSRMPLFTFDHDGDETDPGKKLLIMNLLSIARANVKVDEFLRYAKDGYEILRIRTPRYTYRITMEDLLRLIADGEMSTFVVNGDRIEIYSDDGMVLTLAVADMI